MTDTERKEIELLYLQMYNFMFEYASSVLSNESSSEEVIQEVFRIACQKPDAVTQSPNPQGWMINTLKNVIRNLEKNHAASIRALAKYTSMNSDINEVLPNQIEVDLLYNDVAKTEEYRLIKAMTIDGKSYSELAKERGITIETCRKRMQRAKEFLRKRLK